jgi:putative lipoic acid-binding regulatory protein
VGDSDSTPQAGKQARFEDLLEFPTDFTFRVVAASLPQMAATAIGTVERLTGSPGKLLSTQPSRNGKWTVYRIETTVASADQIRTAYQVLSDIPGVRMVL